MGHQSHWTQVAHTEKSFSFPLLSSVSSVFLPSSQPCLVWQSDKENQKTAVKLSLPKPYPLHETNTLGELCCRGKSSAQGRDPISWP